jgi:lysophospholipase L1-like esterase
MGKWKRLAFTLIINAAILLPLVYGFEVFLEWRDPRKSLPVDGQVNGKLFTWGHPVENNRFGFRERSFEVPKPRSVFRIMVLGDSLTWGAGLAIEERYTNRLEASLNGANQRKRFEVLNFGIPGGPTTEERNLLRQYQDLVRPDLIIVGFCINDPQPKSQDYSIEREKFDAKYARAFTSLKYRFGRIGLPAIAVLIKNAAYGFAEKTNTIPRWDKALDRTYDKSSPEWLEFVKALKDIRQMSDDMKLAPPIFVVLNQDGHTGSDYAHPSEILSTMIRWSREAEQAAGEVGFRTLNYEKEIPVELANDSMDINVVDGHPSAKLNQLYAKKLFSVVVDDAGLK